MVGLIASLLACGEPSEVRSVPTAPTVDLRARPVPLPVLEGLLPAAAGPPTPLGGLKPGASEGDVRGWAKAAADPRVPPEDEVVQGVRTVDLVFRDYPDAGASLLLGDDGTLAEVQVTLPPGAVAAYANPAWGPGPPWEGPDWRATLHEAPGKRELLRLVPR